MSASLIFLLSERSGLSPIDVEQIISSAPRRYKVFQIPKRNDRGMRTIAQPSRELKALQRIVISTVLRDLPVHDCAHGYVSGRGIKSNAACHISGSYLMKLDLSEFFPSLVPADLLRHINKHMPDRFGISELGQLSNILFWRAKGERGLRLCIGAPSSPFISNTLMFDIDGEISSLCVAQGVVYSRYADDMTFSTSLRNVLARIYIGVRNIISGSYYPTISLNMNKTVHSSKKHLRAVTGIVIANDQELSLGRERKHLIRAMVHRSSLGRLSKDDEARLDGLLSFANDIEPQFSFAMRLRRAVRRM